WLSNRFKENFKMGLGQKYFEWLEHKHLIIGNRFRNVLSCRAPASTSSPSPIVSVLVLFGHRSSRRRLPTFLPLHLTIVRVSIFFFRFVPASLNLTTNIFPGFLLFLFL